MTVDGLQAPQLPFWMLCTGLARLEQWLWQHAGLICLICKEILDAHTDKHDQCSPQAIKVLNKHEMLLEQGTGTCLRYVEPPLREDAYFDGVSLSVGLNYRMMLTHASAFHSVLEYTQPHNADIVP